MKESICSQRGSVNSFLLSALESGDKYAYEIGKAVKEISNGKYVLKEASLYSGLKRLEAQGFLTSYKKDLENGLTRRYYSLTEEGRHKLSALDFSWESEQKGTFLKTFNNISNKETDENELPLENNSNLTENVSFETDLVNSQPNFESDSHTQASAITISDEEDNLTTHYIHKDQQDLFSILNSDLEGDFPTNNNSDELGGKDTKTNEKTIDLEFIDPNKTLYTNEQTNSISADELQPNTSCENSLSSVNDFEFINLKNDLKNNNSSFLDEVNSNYAKSFNYKTHPSNDINLEKQASLTNTDKNNQQAVFMDDVLESVNDNKNLNVAETTTTNQPNDLNESISKIDINDIFGDLCINTISSEPETQIEGIDSINENDGKSSAIINGTGFSSNENNINCTLEIPTKVNKEQPLNTTDTDADFEITKNYENNSDLLFSTSTNEDVFNNKNKSLNQLFEDKIVTKKTNITMNNSVLYANQKIDNEKPSFETLFKNKVADTFEIRYFKPIEKKSIKSSFINLGKIKMLASLGALFIQFILTFVIYFVLDKTPMNKFSIIQTVMYITCLSIPVVISITEACKYFLNKFKMVEKIDFKTNIFFKMLFGMCTISTLFITYKFFELNISHNYTFLILMPLCVIVSIIFEEIFKFLLCKSIKN